MIISLFGCLRLMKGVFFHSNVIVDFDSRSTYTHAHPTSSGNYRWNLIIAHGKASTPQSYTNRPWNIGPCWHMNFMVWLLLCKSGQKLWVVSASVPPFWTHGGFGRESCHPGVCGVTYCGPHDFQDNCWTDVPLLAEEQWVFNQHLASRSCM